MHGDLTIFYKAKAVLMLWGCFKECLSYKKYSSPETVCSASSTHNTEI